MLLPELNKRIKEIIDNKTSGNVASFAKLLGISQQKLNRLFLIDNRTKKYPTVPADILTSITEMFVDMDARWLLTGKKADSSMANEPESQFKTDCSICREKDKIIEHFKHQLDRNENDIDWYKHQLNCQEETKTKQKSA